MLRRVTAVCVLALVSGCSSPAEPGATPLGLEQAPSPPEMAVLYAMWTDQAGRAIASGDTGTFASSDGLSWAAIDPALASSEQVLPSTHDLPKIIDVHPAITLLYQIEGAVVGPEGTVVYGHALSTVGAAAVEVAYPELGQVVDVTRITPCDAAGKPMECEIDEDDSLWVRTAGDSDSNDWRAVSLSGMGLTKTDVWRTYRVIWFSEDGVTFEPVVQRVLKEIGQPEVEGMARTEDGFVMIDDGVWTSVDGRSWRSQRAPPYEVTSLFNAGPRVLGGTSRDEVVEYRSDGSWRLLADPKSLRQIEGIADVAIEGVADTSFVAVCYENVLFPEMDAVEPLSTASMLAVSTDGTKWRTISLVDTLGSIGTVEVAIAGDHVVVAYSPDLPDDDSAGFTSVPQPTWWIAPVAP